MRAMWLRLRDSIGIEEARRTDDLKKIELWESFNELLRCTRNG